MWCSQWLSTSIWVEHDHVVIALHILKALAEDFAGDLS